MNKIIPILLTLEALVGCAPCKPSYNGVYEKQESSVSTPEFVDQKTWPENLEIVHRMKYEGNGFRHYLGLRFMPSNQDEAGGEVQFMLSRITNEETGSWPNDNPEGDNFYSERKIYGGAWCVSQVQYWLYAVMPEHELLDEIYPAYVGSIDGQLISPNPQNLDEQYNEEKAEEWFDIFEDGINIELILIRHLESTTSGCYEFDGWLPKDKWGEQWSKVKYFSADPDHSIDMLEKGIYDLQTFDDRPIKVFEKIIPDVGGTDP